jgi:nitrogen-specific signal transduction histidine kinase
MVTAHHGQVSLQTEPGHGAQFTVILPAAAIQGEQEQHAGTHRRATGPGHERPAG